MTVLSEKDLAQEMNLSQWTVRRMRLEEGMPYFTIGKRIYYELENVYKWIGSKQIQSTTAEEGSQYGKIRQII